MWDALSRVLAWPLIGLVRLYRVTLSPYFGAACRFQPTCSAYALDALRRHGAFRGIWLAGKRIGRCHPWGGSGYDPVPDDHEQLRQEQLRQRTQVLNHAYGFASRGNRAGGLEHVYRWLDNDPKAADSWPWFLDHMLRWEDTAPALQYAQRYLKQLLVNGDHIAAVKLMLRCRLTDPLFRPQAEDLELAIAAAEQCGNQELAGALNR